MIDKVKRALAAHGQIPAQLLDPAVLIILLTQLEESVREILAQAQAPQSGPTAFTGAASRPFGAEFGASFAQDLVERFNTAAGAHPQEGSAHQQGASARPILG